MQHVSHRRSDEMHAVMRKATEMRNAIDSVELALNGIENFRELETLWDDCREDVEIKVPMTVGTLRQLTKAYDELNRIINSREYEPANLTT